MEVLLLESNIIEMLSWRLSIYHGQCIIKTVLMPREIVETLTMYSGSKW